jgi:hypothetical protein
VLCTSDGEVLGALPRFEVETPWWMEVALVVEGARERFGVDVTIVRILETGDPWPPHGGAVTYLAETPRPPTNLQPATVDMTDHPSRAPWARPGGVGELVAWADQHIERTGEPQQLRTWNLSLVVRLPTTSGCAWLKAVPPFMAHVGVVIEAMAEIGPPLLARADGVVLLDDVPGEDQYDATAEVCADMVRRWVDVQSRWSIDLGPGLPDWRPASFIPMIERLVDRPELDALVAELPGRFDALAECGLPDTLVHGDFHPGNWRGGGEGLKLLDWGDSGIGHPLLDQPAFLHGNLMDDEKRAAARAAWRDAWRDARPGSDPDRAAEFIAPIAALRAAHIFRMFLDNIEPSEHCYHRHDTEDWLQRAIALAR